MSRMTNQTDGPNQSDQSDQSDHDTSSLDDDEKLEQLATRFLALWREQVAATADGAQAASAIGRLYASLGADTTRMGEGFEAWGNLIGQMAMGQQLGAGAGNAGAGDRKSTRLNSSHITNSYAVFCLQKKTHRDPWSAFREFNY